MLTEDIDPHNGLIEVRVRTLHNVVIEVFLVAENVHPLEDEVEQCLQVLRAGAGNENIGIPMRKRSSNRQAESGRLAATARSGERDSR